VIIPAFSIPFCLEEREEKPDLEDGKINGTQRGA